MRFGCVEYSDGTVCGISTVGVRVEGVVWARCRLQCGYSFSTYTPIPASTFGDIT